MCTSPLFLVRILVPLLAVAACQPRTPTPPITPTPLSPALAPPSASEFGLYLLSMTWEPNRCCTERDRQDCSQLPGSFAATHLTLHGLWPNFTDEQSRGR